MTLQTEDEIKQALGIETWRNLSRDKVLRFAAMMPQMDKEVALGIVAQLPVFTRFSVEALDVLRKVHASTQVSNKQSQDRVHDAYADIRDTLKNELNKDDLSSEDRRSLTELLMETGNREFAKDSENKRFLDGLMSKATVATGAAVLASVVFVGGKVMLQRGEESNPNEV
ncbi:hypothetical protein [Promicromonospora sp. NPDC059942]|uniref:hypothetical protein n=1 Tax=Promicromonospora sp. NPDC059942 TaxID=3347009 RepID=UPI00365C4E9A